MSSVRTPSVSPCKMFLGKFDFLGFYSREMYKLFGEDSSKQWAVYIHFVRLSIGNRFTTYERTWPCLEYFPYTVFNSQVYFLPSIYVNAWYIPYLATIQFHTCINIIISSELHIKITADIIPFALLVNYCFTYLQNWQYLGKGT